MKPQQVGACCLLLVCARDCPRLSWPQQRLRPPAWARCLSGARRALTQPRLPPSQVFAITAVFPLLVALQVPSTAPSTAPPTAFSTAPPTAPSTAERAVLSTHARSLSSARLRSSGPPSRRGASAAAAAARRRLARTFGPHGLRRPRQRARRAALGRRQPAAGAI